MILLLSTEQVEMLYVGCTAPILDLFSRKEAPQLYLVLSVTVTLLPFGKNLCGIY
jgi:hypothetical protein